MGASFYFEGPVIAAANEAVSVARTRAAQQAVPYDQQIVRSLTPQDLTTANTQKSWAWTNISSTGNTANAIVNAVAVADTRFLIIYGVTCPASSTYTQVEITRSGGLARLWNIEGAVNNLASRSQYFLDPVIVDQNNSITINAYSSSVGTLTLVFHGDVVEKAGILISC